MASRERQQKSGDPRRGKKGAIEPTDDRFVPAEYVGTIEPNYYCRGWNGKEGRKKYCRARAGAGTTHVGVGRCKMHGGTKQSLYDTWGQIRSETLREAIARHETDPHLLDLRPSLALLKTLVEHTINEQEEVLQALLTWHALHRHRTDASEDLKRAAAQMLEDAPPPARRHVLDFGSLRDLLAEIRQFSAQIENIAGKVPLTEVDRTHREMARAVELYNAEPDPVKRMEKIRDAWANIRI